LAKVNEFLTVRAHANANRLLLKTGVKNVMFGGEGLFVTELKGPGRVWLQGMPPDRMIAEIASRVPSGGPGIGIPIGGFGGGGASDEAAAAGAEGGSAVEGAGGAEEMVAASDAAIDADRQATVATSGAMSSDDVDADSQSALFGDAVQKDNVTTAEESAGTNTGDDFSWASTSNEPTFDDSKEDTFSTGGTEEPTFDDSGFEESTTFEGAEEAASDAAETAKGIFSTLWDFFTGDD
jgi:Mitochondrial biogenesis AIM24